MHAYCKFVIHSSIKSSDKHSHMTAYRQWPNNEHQINGITAKKKGGRRMKQRRCKAVHLLKNEKKKKSMKQKLLYLHSHPTIISYLTPTTLPTCRSRACKINRHSSLSNKENGIESTCCCQSKPHTSFTSPFLLLLYPSSFQLLLPSPPLNPLPSNQYLPQQLTVGLKLVTARMSVNV